MAVIPLHLAKNTIRTQRLSVERARLVRAEPARIRRRPHPADGTPPKIPTAPSEPDTASRRRMRNRFPSDTGAAVTLASAPSTAEPEPEPVVSEPVATDDAEHEGDPYEVIGTMNGYPWRRCDERLRRQRERERDERIAQHEHAKAAARAAELAEMTSGATGATSGYAAFRYGRRVG